jgi:hypothetical protein
MRTASSRRRVAIGGKRLAAPATPTPAAMSQARRHEELLRASLPQAEIAVADVNARIEVVALAVRSKKDVHVAACAHASHRIGPALPANQDRQLGDEEHPRLRRSQARRVGHRSVAPG